MYITFPNFNSSCDEQCGLRYFKKLMYKYTRDVYENDVETFNFLTREANIEEYGQ